MAESREAQMAGPGADLVRRAWGALDEARAVLTGLEVHDGTVSRALASEAARRLAWAGQWLAEPYRPAEIVPDVGLGLEGGALVARLRTLADAFDALVGEAEETDPLAHADVVQAGSLAYAVVGATAAWLERRLTRGAQLTLTGEPPPSDG